MPETQDMAPPPSTSSSSSPSPPAANSRIHDGVLSARHGILTPSQQLAKKYRTEIAASASSCVSTFIAFPLDSVKTRMQAYKFRSFWDCVTQTKQTEGMRGFWRGSLAPLASVTLVRTVSFSIYSKSKQVYSSMLRPILGDNLISPPNTPGMKPCNPIYWFLSGATAGGAITVIACPFEFTKLSAQIELLMLRSKRSSLDDPSHIRKYKNKGTWQGAKDIVKTRGLLGLYSGFHLHFIRDSLGTAMYFTFYESGKALFSSTGGPSPLGIAASGGLCGLLSWVLIYPVDSAKSIYQRDVLTHPPGQPLPKRPFRFFNRRMYRGLGVSMTRSCILNSVFFSSYEYIKQRVNEFVDE
ncbi:mitochondrial carrier domain-containing protein [Sphaerosporella brunnea]|uniref:Mitochondrial carrier domain-containing protein n=1 Tax=Sphaerosporella brunnea TaxID=1250544 RepID=A0A5J5EJ89_9PEZI|nr:mitochondrial carrier domain-containing protein [Sphaerosporella brunnea]